MQMDTVNLECLCEQGCPRLVDLSQRPGTSQKTLGEISSLARALATSLTHQHYLDDEPQSAFAL